jgi:hypothetical protein
VQLTHEQISEALKHVGQVDDLKVWLEMGMALKAELGEAGRPLWDNWSRNSTKFDENDQNKTWDSIEADGEIKLGTLIKYAKEGGWQYPRGYSNGTAAPSAQLLYTQDDLALLFTKGNGDDLRYVAKWGQWYQWRDGIWRRDDTLHVFDMVRALCRRESAQLPPEEKSTSKLKRELNDARTIAAVERLTKSDRRHAATVDQWDSNLMLLNTPGGTVDLETGQLRASRREDYCTKITAVTPAITADCPNWKKFLQQVLPDDELVAFLQRMAGYMLTGQVNEHALFFFYGTGSTVNPP